MNVNIQNHPDEALISNGIPESRNPFNYPFVHTDTHTILNYSTLTHTHTFTAPLS